MEKRMTQNKWNYGHYNIFQLLKENNFSTKDFLESKSLINFLEREKKILEENSSPWLAEYILSLENTKREMENLNMEAYQKFLQEIILEFSKEEDTNLKKRVIRGLGISPK
jgi:lipopolysaccharide export LptBFGC system permease protein LptF